MAIGQSKQRLDAEAKVTGRARYTDDLGLPGMRHAVFVRSSIAHGMVTAIDAAKALALPGVEAVFTADDVVEWVDKGHKVILVRLETSPEDIEGMHFARGILTVRGGMTSHAAVVARGMGTS